MSGNEPTEGKPEDYRHVHQDIRLNGHAPKSWAQRRDATHQDDVRMGSPSAKSWGERANGVREGSLLRREGEPNSPSAVRAALSQTSDGRVSIQRVDEIFDSLHREVPVSQRSLRHTKAKARAGVEGDLAELSALAKSMTRELVEGSRPLSRADIDAAAAAFVRAIGQTSIANAREGWEMVLRQLSENCTLARNETFNNPGIGKEIGSALAERILHAFQYGDGSWWANPLHARHKNWLDKRAELQLLPPEIWPSFYCSAEIVERLDSRIDIGEVRIMRERIHRLSAAGERHRYNPTADNHQAFLLALAAVKIQSVSADIPIGFMREIDTISRSVEEPITAPDPEPISLEILADVGITATPTAPAENYTDIWCVFVDRDQLDFIGTNRNESRVEIALTLHAAFATMIRMSGFSDEVLADSGIDLDDPCLETLATFLNERTNDVYSFGPYETSIDERLFNFLQ